MSAQPIISADDDGDEDRRHDQQELVRHRTRGSGPGGGDTEAGAHSTLFSSCFKTDRANRVVFSRTWVGRLWHVRLGREAIARYRAKASNHHSEGLEDGVRLDQADRGDDGRDADHDVREEPRDAE